METMTRRKLLAAAGVTAVAAGTGPIFGDDHAENRKPQVFENIPARELIRRHHLPNVELITQDGKRVHFYDDLVKNKKFVIQFMFTHCGEVCPVITSHLAQVQKMLPDRVGRDLFFYSITLSPEEDRPKDLKAYAKAHGARPGWLFLTGKPDDILTLRRALGFTYNDPKEDADRSNHTGMLLIGDEPLTRWAHAEGGARPEWIATVIRTEVEAPFKGSVAGITQADPTFHQR